MSLHENPILTDYFELYELVVPGRRVSDRRLQRYEQDDEVYAFQLVCGLNVEEHQWPQLLGHLLRESNDHYDTVCRQVARLIIRGVIQLYRLPSLHNATPIALNASQSCGFMPSIGNTHIPFRAKKEIFNSVAKAQAFINAIQLTPGLLNAALFDCGAQSRYESFGNSEQEQQKAKALLIDCLATGKAWAYTFERDNSPPKPKDEYLPATGPGIRAPTLGPHVNNPASKVTDFSPRKGVPPKSLDDAAERLHSMKTDINRNGYQCKYTDEELLAMAESGEVTKERYHVRFMEYDYTERNGKAGAMGQTMQGTSGQGAKYWSTTFDQIEDADMDKRLICNKLGLDYDSKKEYVMVIVDTEKAAPITDVKSIVPTYSELTAFANEELPDDFPPEITDNIMNEGFQKEYREHYEAAVEHGYFDKSDEKTIEASFNEYLEATDSSEAEIYKIRKRFRMQNKLGNNQYYVGNGVTKDTNPGQKCGVVETFNFERKEVDLDQLIAADAIRIERLG